MKSFENIPILFASFKFCATNRLFKSTPSGSRDLPDPDKRVVEFLIDRLDVFDRQLATEHSLVERQREAGVDELAVIQRLRANQQNLKSKFREQHRARSDSTNASRTSCADAS